MKQSQRIVKNAVFGIVASVVGGLVYLATVVTIAHSVSVTEFGKYSFVFAFAMFFQLIADAGLPRMLIREVAKNPDGFAPLVGAAASLIWIFALATCLLVACIIPFLHYGWDVKLSALIMSLATLATFHASSYSAVLRAFEDNELNHLGFVLHKIALLALIVAVIKLHFGLIGFVVAHFIANALLWNFNYFLVVKLYAPVPLRIDPPLWKELLVTALPLGGGAMIRQLALQLDVLVLSWMTNMTNVGLFSGPYRISMGLRVIPQTLSLPLFPLYSRTALLSPERFMEAYRWSVKFFLLVSIPLAAFFTAWSAPILRLALGEKYLPAVPAMQLLGLGLIPFFLSNLYQYLFAALDQQKRFLISTAIASSLRVIFLIVLIHEFGFVGPSMAYVCGEILIVTMWIVQLNRLGFPARFFEMAWRPFIAGLGMTAVLYFTRGLKLPLACCAAALASLVYVALLFALKTFSSEEIHHAREGINFFSPFVASWANKLKRNT